MGRVSRMLRQVDRVTDRERSAASVQAKRLRGGAFGT